jgi:NADPH:quinone reductase
MLDASRTRVLRAAQVVAPGQVATKELALPVPGRGEVRVRLEGCGVCASNLEPWAGQPRMTFPLEPGELGHEGWGHVDAAGPEVEDTLVGCRVAILGTRSYATHDLVPAELVAPLPASLDERPVPGEALGCAVSIFDKCKIAEGESVVVIGAGFIGALLIQLAVHAGARVIVVSRNPAALELARGFGAAEIIPMEDHDVIIARLTELTGGQLGDVVIEATGHQWPLDLAAELTREGGRLVIAGFHQSGARQVNMLMWNWKALEIVNAHERNAIRLVQAMRKGIAALEAGTLNLDRLLTHGFPLERLDQALDATRDKPAGFVKGYVLC